MTAPAGPEFSFAVRVGDGTLHSTVNFMQGGQVMDACEVPLWRFWLKRNLDLWRASFKSLIEDLAKRDKFEDKLRSLVIEHAAKVEARSAQGVLPVLGSKTADVIPWEACVEVLDCSERLRLQYRPVRVLEGETLPAPPWLAGQPRVLLLVGDGGEAFDRTTATVSLQDAARKCQVDASGQPVAFELLVAELAPPVELAADVAGFDPHIVFIYAHGRNDPRPGVLVNYQERQWADLGDLVTSIAGGRPTPPPYWVFIACSIGEGDKHDELARLPLAFTTLVKGGAAAMVAMRSRIHPQVGQAFFAELLERVLSGQSLEYASAGARSALRGSRLSGRRWDWAAPRVWTRVTPTERYRWTDGAANDRTRHLQGLEVLRASLGQPAVGLQEPDRRAHDRARAWSEHGRVSVHSDARAVEAKATISAICVAARLRGKTIVPIVPQSSKDSFAGRLEGWAASVRGALPITESTDYASALEILARGDAVTGLGRLFTLPLAFVVLFEAPSPYGGPYEQAVWETINMSPQDSTIVVCGANAPGVNQTGGWLIDQIEELAKMSDRVAAALNTVPMSMRFFAGLRHPTPISDVAALAKEPPDAVLQTGLLVEDGGYGAVLIDSAREELRSRLGDDAIRSALNDYIDRRASSKTSNFVPSDPLAELAIFIDARRDAQVIALATSICHDDSHQWNVYDWLAFADVVDRPRFIPRLDPWIRLEIANAYVQRQQLDEASRWLANLSPTTNIEYARLETMRSEIAKGESRIDDMREHARQAVAVLEQDENDTDPLLVAGYEMNLARIALYFDHDARAAHEKFQDIIGTVNPGSGPRHAEIVATCLRNNAECLFEFRPFMATVDRQKARTQLEQGIAISTENGLNPLAADCTYSLAKLEEREGRIEPAASALYRCMTLARESNYPLAYHIAAMRKFRLLVEHQEVSFGAAQFRELVSPLDGMLSHAWCARYTAQSRLWAAKRWYNLGQYGDADGALKDVVRIVSDKQLPLTAESDLRTLICAQAGIHMIAGKTGATTDWAMFSAEPRVAKWLVREGASPGRIWEACS